MTVNTLNIVAHGPRYSLVSSFTSVFISAGVRDDAPDACGVAHVVCDHNGQIERLKSSISIWCRLQIQPGLYSAIIGGW